MSWNGFNIWHLVMIDLPNSHYDEVAEGQLAIYLIRIPILMSVDELMFLVQQREVMTLFPDIMGCIESVISGIFNILSS